MVLSLRSSKFQKHLQAMEDWINTTPDPLPYTEPPPWPTPHLPNSLWDDITVREWVGSLGQPLLPSETNFIEYIVKNPTTDLPTLLLRQETLHAFQAKPPIPFLTREKEAVLSWFQTTPTSLAKNYLYTVLFPPTWYLQWIKRSPHLLQLYQLYRCYFSPIQSVSYPITTFLAPYWFLTRKLKWKLSLLDYLHTLKTVFLMSRPQPKLLAIMAIYVAIYVYSILQLLDLSYQLHTFRKAMLHKIQMLCKIQQELQETQRTHPEFWKAYEPSIKYSDLFFSCRSNLQTLYRILHTPSLQEKVVKIQRVCAIYHGLHKVSQTLSRGYQFPTYGPETFLGSMKNPMLPRNQVANPLWLRKSLIISGPNAGGKTTYIKSFLWNSILAQSLGIIYASYGQINVVDAFLHHHRIRDITGESSLFQAEMKKMKETLETLPRYKNIVYFLDEPLHSTHPADGSAMLQAFLVYLQNVPHLKVLVTSHYFDIQGLGEAGSYHNISVRATLSPITFDYKIYRGASQQSIGIELLEKEDFPGRILLDAIKIKKKNCSESVL